jgi:two-component system phosphate regulon response regulator PhoB
MNKIDVLVFRDIDGGTDTYRDQQAVIRFVRADPRINELEVSPNTSAFIDWDLPVLSGLEVCRRLRCNSNTSRLWITLAAHELNAQNRRRAAQAGANDCVLGPITRDSIVDSVKARLMSSWRAPRGELQYGDLVVHHAARLVYWKDKQIALMPCQLRLLCFMMENPGQVFTRTQIVEAVGDLDPISDERTVDVWIGRLRRALRTIGVRDLLRTVRSRGYVLEGPRALPKSAKS